MSHLTAVPAYGRDYKSKAAVMADWDDGLDFRLEPSGQYISKADAVASGIRTINIRYGNLRKVMVVKL